MINRWTAIPASFLAAAFVFLAAGNVLAELGPDAAKVTIGVAIDGESEWVPLGLALIEKELETLTAGSPEVVFKRAPEFDAGWDHSRARAALEAALRDPDVDIVLTLGVLVAAQAAAPDFDLAKPVVNAFIDEAEILGLKYDEHGHSSKKNLNYVAVPFRATRDLEAFRAITAFKSLGLIIDSLLFDYLPPVSKLIKQAESRLGAKITVVPGAESAQAVLDAIPDGLDAVYLTTPLRMNSGEWKKLIEGINKKKLPSFSMNGHSDVALGVLAGIWADHTERMARRLAMNLQMIMSGEPAEQLPVLMHAQEDLLFNAATAAEIGFHPSLDLMIGATILYEDSLLTGRPLSFNEAMALAVENSPQLAATRAGVKTTALDRDLAMSAFLPQVNANGQYSRIDEDRAESSFGSVPEEKTTLGGAATQAIFNDGLFSRYRMAGRLLEGALGEAESERLDIMEQAGRAYIQFMQANAMVRIEADTLNMTRNNLMLAKLRRELGAAGPEEPLRWEAEAALRKASLIKSVSQAGMARVQANRMMGAAQEDVWTPVELGGGSEGYYFLGGRLDGALSDERQLRAFSEFAVIRALAASPLLHAMDRRLDALDIQLAQSRRRFFLPELAMSFSYDRILSQTGAGQSPAMPGISAADDNEWMFAVQASYPLFEGGGSLFATRRAASEREQLAMQREHARQMTEQNARNVLHSLDSSFPNMRLQREAAEASRKNLDIIREKYASGSVAILSLLDAQNQSFVANQQSAAAVYAYLSDIVDLQRVMCWFEWEKTEAEKDAFAAEIAGYSR